MPAFDAAESSATDVTSTPSLVPKYSASCADRSPTVMPRLVLERQMKVSPSGNPGGTGALGAAGGGGGGAGRGVGGGERPAEKRKNPNAVPPASELKAPP